MRIDLGRSDVDSISRTGTIARRAETSSGAG
jgi:hypothetical protein